MAAAGASAPSGVTTCVRGATSRPSRLFFLGTAAAADGARADGSPSLPSAPPRSEIQPVSSAAIPYGSAGVVVTCDQGKERNASRDLVRNLNDAYERVFPDERRPERPADASGTNVADALAAELKDLKETDADEDAKRFKPLNLDFKACMFVTMRADAAKKAPPSRLVHEMLVKIRDRDQDAPRSRHGIRLIPCDTVCFAGIDEIKKALAPLIAEHFPVPSETDANANDAASTKTFAVTFASRANSSMRRADVIPAVAELVPPPHKVDLTRPDLTIMVEVMKGTCCLAVVKDYYGLLKYNARLLALSEEERNAEKARTAMPPKPPPEDERDDAGKDEEKKGDEEK